MRTHAFTLLVATTSLLAACGSSDSTESAETVAATTVAEATTVEPTTAPPTTVAPTTTVLEPRTYDPTKILHEGFFYTAGTVAIGAEIIFTATDRSRYSNNLPGFFSVQGQASGDETLLSLNDLSTMFVFKDPLQDFATLGRDNSALLAASDPVPADFLAYVQGLPGVTAGPVTDAEFAGLPARSMTYEVGDFPGVVCVGTKPCLWTTFAPAGISVYYNPGDSGTFYVFDVAGRSVLADVQNRDGVAEFIATMTIQG